MLDAPRRYPRPCLSPQGGPPCYGLTEVVLVSPTGLRFFRCQQCAERDLEEYSRTEDGWHIEQATESERYRVLAW
jgi:hypothetical protein